MEQIKLHRCEVFVNAINSIFQDELKLSERVVHFIDSTFSYPSLQELGKILADEHNCEKDALVELIFFPDESIQTQLEPIIGDETFEADDGERIANHPALQHLKAVIRFPDQRGSFTVEPSPFIIRQFISRLNIAKKLDERILGAINRRIHEKTGFPSSKASRVRVKLRNARCIYTDPIIDCLCVFFEKMDPSSPDFFPCLDFLLEVLNEVKPPVDLFQSLMKKKRVFCRQLRKVEKFAAELKNNNIETLMLQRYEIPCVNVENLYQKIQMTDKISLTVFGIMYPLDSNTRDMDEFNFSTGRDAGEIFKMFS